MRVNRDKSEGVRESAVKLVGVWILFLTANKKTLLGHNSPV